MTKKVYFTDRNIIACIAEELVILTNILKSVSFSNLEKQNYKLYSELKTAVAYLHYADIDDKTHCMLLEPSNLSRIAHQMATLGKYTLDETHMDYKKRLIAMSEDIEKWLKGSAYGAGVKVPLSEFPDLINNLGALEKKFKIEND